MFKITIEETRSVRKIIPKSWEKTGQQEKARDRQFCSGENESKTYMSDTYDYTPEVETVVSETVEILKQTVEVLDLAKVIRAINDL